MWSVTGPAIVPLTDLDAIIDPAGPAFAENGRAFISNAVQSLGLKERVWRHLPRVLTSPVHALADRWEALCEPRIHEPPRRTVRIDESGTVDLGLFAFGTVFLSGWAETVMYLEESAVLEITCPIVGPAALWVDDRPVAVSHRFGYVEPFPLRASVSLPAGAHRIIQRADMIAWREARLLLGARIDRVRTPAAGIPVGISFDTAAAGEDPARLSGHQVTEEADRPGLSDSPTAVKAPSPIYPPDPMLIATPEKALGMDGRADPPIPSESTGTQESRSAEALRVLADRTGHPFAALARVVLGEERELPAEAVAYASAFLNRRFDCADFFGLWLVTVMYRDREHPILSDADRKRVTGTLLNFRYWIDDPGVDGMCFFTENHQIIFHVLAFLAGSLFPGRQFANSGRTGRSLASRAESRILAWIEPRLSGGFSEWDSSAYLAMDAYAMLTLLEFTGSDVLSGAARRLLDHIFFRLALNSWRGIHGCSHGRCYTGSLKSAREEGTSGLQRIAWGLGIFAGEPWATGSLALSTRYRVPDAIVTLALTGIPFDCRQRSSGMLRRDADLSDRSWEVRTVVRRRSGYMLAAAVDLRPGDPGIQEHLWQATLGTEALVFTTYPANTEEAGHARPNFWAGSARLPRVWMEGRTVAVLYRILPEVGLGRTHAHFPVTAFDEWSVEGHLAVARVGSAYLGLWSDGILNLSTRQDGAPLRSADRELTTSGGRAWVCRTGCADEDGSFEAFTASLKANPPGWDGIRVDVDLPEGGRLSMGWDGPVELDGQPLSLWDESFQMLSGEGGPRIETVSGGIRLTVGKESCTLATGLHPAEQPHRPREEHTHAT